MRPVLDHLARRPSAYRLTTGSRLRLTGRASSTAMSITVAVLVVLATVVMIIGLTALSIACFSLLVTAAWNWCGLHSVFNAPELTFWQVVGVGTGLTILRMVFSR